MMTMDEVAEIRREEGVGSVAEARIERLGNDGRLSVFKRNTPSKQPMAPDDNGLPGAWLFH